LKSAYCLAPDLAYGSLSSAPTLGNRWRVGVEFDAVTIDQKYRAVTPHSLILDHRHMAVVQHQPISVEPGRDQSPTRSNTNVSWASVSASLAFTRAISKAALS
jgi:hypothetical protein